MQKRDQETSAADESRESVLQGTKLVGLPKLMQKYLLYSVSLTENEN